MVYWIKNMPSTFVIRVPVEVEVHTVSHFKGTVDVRVGFWQTDSVNPAYKEILGYLSTVHF